MRLFKFVISGIAFAGTVAGYMLAARFSPAPRRDYVRIEAELGIRELELLLELEASA